MSRRSFFFAILAWFSAIACAQSQTPPPADISIILPQSPAPATVHVHALDIPVEKGSPLTARYEWDFGDPTGKYNSLVGWNAAHVYDNPGEYQVKLTLTDESGTARQFTRRVTVGEQKRRDIWVSHIEGNDFDDGSDLKHAVQTVDRAMELARSNCRVLLHRGGVFEASRTRNLPVSDLYIGAFGEGERPILKWTGDRTTGFFFAFDPQKSHDVFIENLVFDTPFTQDNEQNIPSAFRPAGRNFTVRNCEFRNLAYVVSGLARPTGVLVQDNTCPLATGIRAYFCWVENTDWTIVGNTVANSTREHCIRSSDNNAKRILISGNDITNLDRTTVDKDDQMKTTINIRAGSYVYITGNKLSDGTVGFGPTPNMPDANSAEWIVLDSNRITNATVKMTANTKHLFARNNILKLDVSEQFLLQPTDVTHSPWTVADISIVHNTGIVAGVKGKFLKLPANPPAGTVTLRNNLFVAPKMKFGDALACCVDVRAPDLKCFAAISDNVWPDSPKVHFVSSSLDIRGYANPATWNQLPPVRNDIFEAVTLDAQDRPNTQTRVPFIPWVDRDLAGKLRPAAGAVPGALEP